MRYLRSIPVLSLCLLFALLAQPAHADRPKIGLALSGGGAKGSAHIAVLELIEANNIPIDYVAGTSIGAYVGGLYALGYSAPEIKQIMYSAELERGYSDAIDRARLPFREKRQYDKFNIRLDAGYRDGEFHLPSGVLYGQSMSAAYRRSVGNIPRFDSFDELAIPFRAVATDLATSEAVAISHGDLVQAMKASAAVPGALVPVELEDRLLVDGGMSQNLPISEVRRMGADIVIAVDISSLLLAQHEIDDALAVLDQILNFLTVKNLEADKKLLGERDIYIRPLVDDLSTGDFSDLDRPFAAGMTAAIQQRQALRQLSVSEAEYEEYQRGKRQKLIELKRRGNLPIAKVVLINRSNFNDQYLLDTLGIEPGLPLSTAQLLRAVDRVYSLGKFERVEAEIEDRTDGRAVIVEAVEKSWGPNYFDVGLGWEDDFTLDSVINLDFAFTIGNITENNGEWRNELGIGTDKTFRSEVYLPLDQNHNLYQASVYEYQRTDRNYFIDNERAFIFDQTSHSVELGLGYIPGHVASFEAGLSFEQGKIDNKIFLEGQIRYSSPGLYLKFGYDSLDRISFPTRGNRLTLQINARDEDVSGDLFGDGETIEEEYRSIQYLLDWKGALSRGNHGIIGIASMAYLDSEIDESIHFVELGGFLNLSGYHRNALFGNNKVFAALAYQYNLGSSLFGLNNFPIYAGASLEAGNVWPAAESIKASDLINAGSIYLSTDSKLGPIALAYGAAEGGNRSIYFYLGKNL